MQCGCIDNFLVLKLCPVHEEISNIVTRSNPDWKRVSHLVQLGYRKNNQGTLPKIIIKIGVQNG